MPVREAFLKNVNATNSTRAQLICEDICALCAHLWPRELPGGQLQARERAQ
jgi:hypothetical protein